MDIIAKCIDFIFSTFSNWYGTPVNRSKIKGMFKKRSKQNKKVT